VSTQFILAGKMKKGQIAIILALLSISTLFIGSPLFDLPVISLVFSLLGIFFGIKGLKDSRKLATAAIIISLLGLLFFVLFYIYRDNNKLQTIIYGLRHSY